MSSTSRGEDRPWHWSGDGVQGSLDMMPGSREKMEETTLFVGGGTNNSPLPIHDY